MSLVGLQDGMTSEIRPALLIVWAAVGIVLVAACVNLAGLMFTRAARRRREIATRLALGSGRGAVVRQLLVEAGVLGLAGGAAGIAVAAIAVRRTRVALGRRARHLANRLDWSTRGGGRGRALDSSEA